MKFDGFPGEKVILSFQLIDGNGWLTTDRIVLQHEKYSRRFKIEEKLWPEMYLLRDFEKVEVKGETLVSHFKGRQKATIQLRSSSPSLLQEVKDYIEEAVRVLSNAETSTQNNAKP